MSNEIKAADGALAAAQEIFATWPISTLQASPEKMAEIIASRAVQPEVAAKTEAFNEALLASKKCGDQWQEVAKDIYNSLLTEYHKLSYESSPDTRWESSRMTKIRERLEAYEKLKQESK